MRIASLLIILALFTAAPTIKGQDLPKSSATLPIKFFCTNWGMQGTWDSFCAKVKEAGYDGVETWLPGKEEEILQMLAAFEKYDLDYIFLSSGNGKDFNAYLNNYTENIRKLLKYSPVLINCHTGKDYFSFEQNKALIEAANKISAESGIPILHETHRGRFSFAAHITQNFLERIPDLRLTLDISHWCNVHESMLADQQEAVSLAISRTDHIHARVGFQEGPQVNDPRAPEWKNVLDQHLKWWDRVVDEKTKKGDTLLTVTPEFGPPYYMQALPYTQQPVSSQWDINVFMMNLLKKRYKKQ